MDSMRILPFMPTVMHVLQSVHLQYGAVRYAVFPVYLTACKEELLDGQIPILLSEGCVFMTEKYSSSRAVVK
jgi:hypothetical protein